MQADVQKLVVVLVRWKCLKMKYNIYWIWEKSRNQWFQILIFWQCISKGEYRTANKSEVYQTFGVHVNLTVCFQCWYSHHWVLNQIYNVDYALNISFSSRNNFYKATLLEKQTQSDDCAFNLFLFLELTFVDFFYAKKREKTLSLKLKGNHLVN